MKEIRLSQSDCVAVYALACKMEHSCTPNVRITFDKQYNVSPLNATQYLLFSSPYHFSFSRSQ